MLWLLADGFEAEEIYRDPVTARAEGPAGGRDGTPPEDRLADAVSRTRTRIALVTGPEGLADILTKPFAAWRVLLHPAQHRIAYRPAYAGPAQVTGGPGTGKTVVALHRVKLLLTTYTTYTTAPACSLHASLASSSTTTRRCSTGSPSPPSTRWPSAPCATCAAIQAPRSATRRRARWQKLARALELPLNDAFLARPGARGAL